MRGSFWEVKGEASQKGSAGKHRVREVSAHHIFLPGKINQIVDEVTLDSEAVAWTP